MVCFSCSCSVEPALTSGGNIELVLAALTNGSQCDCYNVSVNMTAAINRSIETVTRRRRETTNSLPTCYQFILLASEAEIEASINNTNNTNNGGNNNGTSTPATNGNLVLVSLLV